MIASVSWHRGSSGIREGFRKWDSVNGIIIPEAADGARAMLFSLSSVFNLYVYDLKALHQKA